jgi:hypothetical protein
VIWFFASYVILVFVHEISTLAGQVLAGQMVVAKDFAENGSCRSFH